MLQVTERPFRLGVRLDEVERRAIDAAVAASGLTLSDWVRRSLADAAKAESEPVNVFVQAHNRRQR